MNIELVKIFLLWNFTLNYLLLIFWFLMIFCANDWVFKVHSKFFKITREQFNGVHYAGIAFFKIGIFMFFLIPYIALCIAT